MDKEINEFTPDPGQSGLSLGIKEITTKGPTFL